MGPFSDEYHVSMGYLPGYLHDFAQTGTVRRPSRPFERAGLSKIVHIIFQEIEAIENESSPELKGFALIL